MVQAAFVVPDVEDNEGGWGPTSVPTQLEGIPYAPYAKAEKVGRISDFTQSGFNKFNNRNTRDQAPGVAVFNFFHNEEEDSFHLVDNKPAQKNRQPGRRFFPNRFQRMQQQRAQEAAAGPPTKLQKQKQQQRFNFFGRQDGRQVQYSSSVDIRPEWAVVEQIPFSSLTKLNFTVGKPEDLRFCGDLEYYDRNYDRVTPKADKPLRKTPRAFRSVTTSDDPILKELAQQDVAKVFITDMLLTTLMCAPRSNYSWDIVVTRVADKLFFDKRDGSHLDLLTVAETAPEGVPEEKDNINGVQQLSVEATAVNQAFSQQVLLQGDKRYKCGDEYPFKNQENEQLAATAYRYRKFRLNEDTNLVVRCELDGVMPLKGEDVFLSIKSLLEYDSKITGVDWRQKLDTQRGAVLATELKNNANKLAKWTAAAMLSGAELIKLGYISRVQQRDPKHHAILGTQVCKPRDFAMQINLNMDNCWGIVRALVDLCLKLSEGKYLLVKEPNKPIMRLYQVPDNAFEQTYTEEPMQETEEAAEAPQEGQQQQQEAEAKEEDEE